MSSPARSARVEPSNLARRVVSYLRSCVTVDTRSLAAFRVVVGGLAFVDVLLRSRNFTFFYTDAGVAPQSLARSATPDYAFSIYYATTDPYLIAGLFVLQALIALQLIVGYRTRIATILTFLFVVSLDHHNPFITSYADTLFRLLLFWGIFLPLGERFSVDAVHRDRDPRAQFFGAASVLILLQMVVMYLVNGLHKTQSDLWTSGEATPLIMGIDEITFLLGDFTREFPTLLQVGGLTWYYLLLASPLLLLLRGRLRMPHVVLLMGGHATFAVTVRIGQFAYVAIAGLVLFVQTPVWEAARRILERASVDVDELYASLAPGLARYAGAVPDYRIDSEWFDRKKADAYDFTVTALVVAIVLILLVGGFQFGSAVADGASPGEGIETAYDDNEALDQVNDAKVLLGVDQPVWSVFAPHPRTTDRYYVFAAETTTGEHYDAYNDRELTYERPGEQLQEQYGTYRERFYMNSVRRSGQDGSVAVELGDYLCRNWTTEDGEELVRLNMYYIGEEITPETIDDHGDREIQSVNEIHNHGCGANEPAEIDPPAL